MQLCFAALHTHVCTHARAPPCPLGCAAVHGAQWLCLWLCVLSICAAVFMKVCVTIDVSVYVRDVFVCVRMQLCVCVCVC